MREILITSAFLILCVLLIRRIFREKVSRRLLYALWLLVALRLMIPGSAQFGMGPLSQIRLMDLLEEDKSGITERLEETVSLEEPIQMTIDARSIWFRLFADDAVREAMRDISNDGPTAVFLAGKLGFTRLDVLRFIWIAGMVVVSAWILITNMVFGRRLKKSRKPFDLPEEICTAASLQALGGDGKGPVFSGRRDVFPYFIWRRDWHPPVFTDFWGGRRFTCRRMWWKTMTDCGMWLFMSLSTKSMETAFGRFYEARLWRCTGFIRLYGWRRSVPSGTASLPVTRERFRF